MSDRHQILDDKEFWTRLEYAASRWPEDSDDETPRRFWVDGFLPDAATNTEYGADVEGVAWVGDGPRKQDQYHFIALLPQKMLHRRIPNFAIERLSLDKQQRVLQIALASAKSTAEPTASLNGGPAEPPRNSGAGGGPPSVS